jgi:hypothetical protein
VDHSKTDTTAEPVKRDKRNRETTPEFEGITPLNPSTFPRAEDDEETFAHSPEFHDLPDPGSDVGRKQKRDA